MPPEVSIGNSETGLSLLARDADVSRVLGMIADRHQLNLVVAPEIDNSLTLQIRDATLEEILTAISTMCGLHWHREGQLLYVTRNADRENLVNRRGRFLRIYELNFVAAEAAMPVVNNLLSPMGTAQSMPSEIGDPRRHIDRIVVEDVQTAHQSIAQCLMQLDVQPRQVLIEAHLLQVNLGSGYRHGINLATLARLGNSRLEMRGAGFANLLTDDQNGNGGGSTGPSVSLSLGEGDLSGLIETLQTCSHARTLASPKVSVINGQQGRIQIGRRLPYRTSTTTQTVTVENVDYLEVGIVLTVTPTIAADGKILLDVYPKVSDGFANESELFTEETTELQTTTLVPDGGGVVIGGLINEKDVRTISKAPFLGDVPLLGKLFRREVNETTRQELIVALVAHVVHHPGVAPRTHECDELGRTLPHHAMIELSTPPLTTPPSTAASSTTLPATITETWNAPLLTAPLERFPLPVVTPAPSTPSDSIGNQVRTIRP